MSKGNNKKVQQYFNNKLLSFFWAWALPFVLAYIIFRLIKYYDKKKPTSNIKILFLMPSLMLIAFLGIYLSQFLSNEMGMRNAINSGDAKKVQELIKKGIDVNYADVHKETYLMSAAGKGDIGIIKSLINAGANINAQNIYGTTALRNAIGHEDVMRLLIKNGANLNITNKFGQTALMDAIFPECNNGAKFLIDAGADFNIIGQDGTALDIASKSQNKEMIKILRQLEAISGKKSKSIIAEVFKGNVENINSLINSGADINARDKDGWTLLMDAIWLNDEKVVDLLVSAKAKIDAVDSEGETALMRAIHQNSHEIIMKLINAGADVRKLNNQGLDALWIAIEQNDAEIVKLLLKAGADPNWNDKSGMTPLIHAIIINNTDIVKALVYAGANAKIKINGLTAIERAEKIGNKEIISFLQQFN